MISASSLLLCSIWFSISASPCVCVCFTIKYCAYSMPFIPTLLLHLGSESSLYLSRALHGLSTFVDTN